MASRGLHFGSDQLELLRFCLRGLFFGRGVHGWTRDFPDSLPCHLNSVSLVVPQDNLCAQMRDAAVLEIVQSHEWTLGPGQIRRRVEKFVGTLHCWNGDLSHAEIRTRCNKVNCLMITIANEGAAHTGAKILNFIQKFTISMSHKIHIFKIPISQNSHLQNLIFDKIQMFSVSFLTKFTISIYHISQNSHFQSLIFHKIHIFQTSNSW